MEAGTAARIAWEAPRHRRRSRYVTLGIVAGLHLVAVTLFVLQKVTRERHEALPEAEPRGWLVYLPPLSEAATR